MSPRRTWSPGQLHEVEGVVPARPRLGADQPLRHLDRPLDVVRDCGRARRRCRPRPRAPTTARSRLISAVPRVRSPAPCRRPRRARAPSWRAGAARWRGGQVRRPAGHRLQEPHGLAAASSLPRSRSSCITRNAPRPSDPRATPDRLPPPASPHLCQLGHSSSRQAARHSGDLAVVVADDRPQAQGLARGPARRAPAAIARSSIVSAWTISETSTKRHSAASIARRIAGPGRLRGSVRRPLVQRGGVERRAAIAARRRGRLERPGDLLVPAPPSPRRGDAPRASSDRAVRASVAWTRRTVPPVAAGHRGLGQERMARNGSPGPRAGDARLSAGSRPPAPRVRPTEGVDRRLGRQCREQERVARCGRASAATRFDAAPRAWPGSAARSPGATWPPASCKRSRDLERVEGIAVRRSSIRTRTSRGNDGRAAPGRAGAGPRAGIGPTWSSAFAALPPGCQRRAREPCRRAADRQEDASAAVDEAPDRVGEDGHRRVVEPLRVVDRQTSGRSLASALEERRRRDRQRPLVRQLARRLGSQDGDLEGVPLDGQTRARLG